MVALKSDTAAEKSNEQLSRDFPGRSIFDFCNNIERITDSSRTSVALLFDDFVGEREKRRRDREAERRPQEFLRSSLRGRGFQGLTSQKNVFRPIRWGKLPSHSRCGGLVRERLDQRRTANVAANVAAAMASG